MVGVTEQAGGLLLPTQGHVTVDLVDARTGRVVQREEADNFLSLQTLRVARWWQRMMWGAYNPIITADAYGNLPHEMPWFPAQHLAYWNDAAAEVPATEDYVRKELIGWASRHPVGSPSGKRGVVNITESAFTEASAKWVFDWTTSQGNGTFQSVGWTRIREETAFPIARTPDDDQVIITPTTGTGSASWGSPLYWDASTSLWYIVEYINNSPAPYWRIASAPAVGGTTTSVCTITGTTWSAQGVYGLARLGTDFIVSGSQSNLPRLARVTAAGTQTWVATPTATNIVLADCTVDGSSNIWTAASDGVVRRHSNTDGTITATVAPTLAPTYLTGIAYDPADGNFWVLGTIAAITNQLWKMDSSGNTVGPLFSLYATTQNVSSTTPYAGTYQIPAAQARDSYRHVHSATSEIGGSIIAPVTTRTAGLLVIAGTTTAVTVRSGVPVLGGRITAGNQYGTSRATAINGGTLGTRSLLGSPVVKTNAQTLKITYQFNFS
jgi:hypothetical protein